jgi:hypothetical protein
MQTTQEALRRIERTAARVFNRSAGIDTTEQSPADVRAELRIIEDEISAIQMAAAAALRELSGGAA